MLAWHVADPGSIPGTPNGPQNSPGIIPECSQDSALSKGRMEGSCGEEGGRAAKNQTVLVLDIWNIFVLDS